MLGQQAPEPVLAIKGEYLTQGPYAGGVYTGPMVTGYGNPLLAYDTLTAEDLASTPTTAPKASKPKPTGKRGKKRRAPTMEEQKAALLKSGWRPDIRETVQTFDIPPEFIAAYRNPVRTGYLSPEDIYK